MISGRLFGWRRRKIPSILNILRRIFWISMMSISIATHQASINQTTAPAPERAQRKKSPTLIARSLCPWDSEFYDRDRG